jgi:hypothetical protein
MKHNRVPWTVRVVRSMRSSPLFRTKRLPVHLDATTGSFGTLAVPVVLIWRFATDWKFQMSE